MGGTVARDIFLDAVALDDVATEGKDWHPWPLICNDGDTAALVQLVSEDKVFSYNNYLDCPLGILFVQVEFEVDTSQAQAARPILDWNSKKTGETQFMAQ